MLVSGLAIAQPAPSTAPDADPTFSVAVEKDDVALSCPELPWFRARIAAHAGQAGHVGQFKVTLTKRGSAWRARIQRREPNSDLTAAERVLEDRSTACEPLAEAVAVTIAILADDLAKSAESPAPPLAAKQPLHKPPVAAADQRTPSDSKVWVGAGGGAALSFISPIAPVLGFGVALDSAYLRQGLRLMLTTEQKFELDPGSVFVQAWLATIFSCLRLARPRIGVALCAAADASLLRASAEGFDAGTPSTRSYGALGLELQPGWHISDNYRISAVLAALLPLTRESFSVAGRGVAYVPPRLNWRILVFSEIGTF